MNKSNLRVCIYDLPGSSYLSQALKLAPYFSKAYYYVDYKSPFPLIAPQKPGTGYDQIEVITDFWANLDNFDLVIFPDIYSKDIGHQLKKAQKLIFGGGNSEDIETNRGLFYAILERLNMANANFATIQGITKLKSYLKNKKNKFIKLSYFRGQIETFKWLNQRYNQQQLDELEFELGPNGDSVEFIVQDMIDADAEFGFDGYAVNGELPTKFVQGIEIKDAGYLGKVDSYSNAPKPITEINDQFSPALKAYAHSGFYSTEVRYDTKTKQSYYIDPCMRMGNPPSNVYLSLINNWDKIIEQGAKGILVEPTFSGKYGCEIILKSSYTNDNYMPVFFPEEYRNNINLKGSFILNGITYVIPFHKSVGFNLAEIGSVVVTGTDYNEVIKQALEIAGSIEAYDIHYSSTAAEDALKQITDLEDKLGYQF